jgi:membrane protease YdiL (CAAX protease family)
VEKISISPRSPLSPAHWNPDAFPLGATLLVALGFVVMLFAGDGLALALTRANPRSILAAPLSPVLVELQLIAYLPIVLYGLAAVPFVARRSLAELGLRRLRAGDVIAGVVGAFAMFASVSAVAAIQSFFVGEHEQAVVKLFERSSEGPALLAFIAITVAVAPFVEEFVFRAFLFNALLRRMAFPAAAFASGALFAASHADPYALVPLTFGGAVLAAVYYRTGSLWSSMITHGLFNGTSLFLIFAKESLHL